MSMNVWIFSVYFSGELCLFAMPLSQPDQYSHNSLLHFLSENRTSLIGFLYFFLLSKAVNQIVEIEKTEGGRGVGWYAEHPGKLWIKCFILIIITNHGGTIRIIRRKIIPQGRDKDWGREGRGGAAECKNPHGMWLSPDNNIPRLIAIMKFHFSIFLIYTDTYINYLGEVFQFPANHEFALKCFNCEIPRYINFHSLRMLSSPSE